jgi:hypothetical protein
MTTPLATLRFVGSGEFLATGEIDNRNGLTALVRSDEQLAIVRCRQVITPAHRSAGHRPRVRVDLDDVARLVAGDVTFDPSTDGCARVGEHDVAWQVARCRARRDRRRFDSRFPIPDSDPAAPRPRLSGRKYRATASVLVSISTSASSIMQAE